MSVEVKFCGLTRVEDARVVAEKGGRYAGVIFAAGPRRLDVAQAAAVLSALAPDVRRVAVFGAQSPSEIAAAAAALALDVVQLHADPAPERVAAVRAATGLEVWAVVRVGDPAKGSVDERVAGLDAVADGILLDTFVPGRAGGSGMRFDWGGLGPGARPRRARLIAAGGLTPENVRTAIRALAPSIVDVSSGVERATGIKDHDRMRAFADAAHQEDGAA